MFSYFRVFVLLNLAFSTAAGQDNRHIVMKDLKQSAWTWANLDFTRDAKRNDGKDTPFAAGHKVDDVFFLVQPEETKEVELFIDEVVLYDAGESR